jgi:hypothetical protein
MLLGRATLLSVGRTVSTVPERLGCPSRSSLPPLALRRLRSKGVDGVVKLGEGGSPDAHFLRGCACMSAENDVGYFGGEEAPPIMNGETLR